VRTRRPACLLLRIDRERSRVGARPSFRLQLTPYRHRRSALIVAQRLRESALGEITISDEAGECATVPSAKPVRRTCAKAGLTVCNVVNRLVAAIGYMPHTKSQRHVSSATDKHDRLRLSDPMCGVCSLPPRDSGSSSMSLSEHRTRPGCRISSLDSLAGLQVVKVSRGLLEI
jgi:hypothetical protein